MAHCQITDPQNYVCPPRNVNHFHAYQTHPADDQASLFSVIWNKNNGFNTDKRPAKSRKQIMDFSFWEKSLVSSLDE